MINLNRYVKFMIDHNFTQRQLLLMLCVYKQHEELILAYKQKFPADDKDSMIGSIETDDLFERGFLAPYNNRIGCIVTSKFKDIFYDDYECGDEFWELYPATVIHNGKRYPLTLTDKNKFRKLYAERINYDKEEHYEVIKDLEYAIDKNMVYGRIDTFVKSEQWTAIRKERLGKFKPKKVKKVDDNLFNY